RRVRRLEGRWRAAAGRPVTDAAHEASRRTRHASHKETRLSYPPNVETSSQNGTKVVFHAGGHVAFTSSLVRVDSGSGARSCISRRSCVLAGSSVERRAHRGALIQRDAGGIAGGGA